MIARPEAGFLPSGPSTLAPAWGLSSTGQEQGWGVGRSRIGTTTLRVRPEPQEVHQSLAYPGLSQPLRETPPLLPRPVLLGSVSTGLYIFRSCLPSSCPQICLKGFPTG